MRPFWRTFFAASLAIFVIGGFLTFVFIGSLAAILSNPFDLKEGGERVESNFDRQNKVLHIRFKNPLSERSFSEFDKQAFEINKGFGLREIKIGLDNAKNDKRIKGILINASTMPAGMATTEEIRMAIEEFKKESGKFVIAYSETYSQKAYYLSTVADKIYLYPEGMLEFQGLSVEYLFFKKAIDKLELDVQVIRGSNNKFKSAVEPFMYDHMSEANREQTMTYLNALWGQMLSEINRTRGLSVDEMNTIADSLYVRSAETAKKYGLVDDLIYEDELTEELKELANVQLGKDLKLENFQKYCTKATRRFDKQNIKENIAVVYAVGGIESGKGNAVTIGSETIAKAIRDARNNINIKALVLRVNSPGGSALASDVIWREMVLTKEIMPVIVSMGDVAASGGYYISCPADKIFALPNTITGSIGVFGVLPNISKPLENKLGITVDRAYTNRPSLMTITRKLTPEEYKIIQEGVDDIYMDFKTKVAEGRPMLDVAGVDSIGQGRVWAGTDAIEIGLVDELGGIDAAIDYAAEVAGVDEVHVEAYPKSKVPKIFEILEQIEENEEDASALTRSPIAQKITEFTNAVKKAASVQGYQARLPYEIIIKP